MRFLFVRGWILPHVLLAGLILFLVLVLPRRWNRFRVEPTDGRLLVAVAFGMPVIVLGIRWAIQTDLGFLGMRDATPLGIYLSWTLRLIVFESVFLALVVYLLRAIKVGDRFSFLVLLGAVLAGSMLALYGTLPGKPTEATDVIAPRT